MSDININMDLTTEKKLSGHQIGFLLLAILLGTYLRVSLLLIYPILVIIIFMAFHWKLDRNAIYLFLFVLFIWLLSFRNGFHLKYNIVSFYFFIPFLLLLFAVPPKTDHQRNYLKMLMDALTLVAIINNIFGIIQFIIKPGDDRFEGIYGSFTVSQNGLSLINAVLFFYHLTVYQFQKKSINLVLFIFFLICSVMGFYGAGMMVLILTLILTFFNIRLKNILKLIIITGATLAGVIMLMKLISPATFDYNVAIIKRFLHPSAANAPRKLIIFQNYFNAYTSNLIDFLFGSGPGTFNSRSAFMVGSPSYFNLGIIKSDAQPYFFREYAYTLWNPSNTGPYDGFMNQPFTTILSILGEYGLIFTILLFYTLSNRYKYFVRLGNKMAKAQGVSIEFRMYKFCSILALLLILIDNYLEYPEIIAMLLITIKFSQQELRKAFNV